MIFNLFPDVNDMKSTNCIPVKKKKVLTFEKIKEKLRNDPLYSISDLNKDFWNVFKFSFDYRCHSLQSYDYINSQVINYNRIINNLSSPELISSSGKTLLHEIISITSKFITTLASNHLEFKQATQPRSLNYRFYQRIDFYTSGMLDDSSILDKLKTTKTPLQCPIDCCCFSLEKLGSFSLEKSTWKSKCPNRRENMECGYQSHKGKCKNMAISLLQGKVLGVDVEEQVCWGIDTYIKNFIAKVLNRKIEEEIKFNFIQYDLIKALNMQVKLFLYL